MAKPTKKRASAAPTTSVRPRPRPAIVDLTPYAEAGDQEFVTPARPSAAPTTSVRPRPRPEKKMAGGAVKYAGGGMCRGMGAATKGGNYKKNG